MPGWQVKKRQKVRASPGGHDLEDEKKNQKLRRNRGDAKGGPKGNNRRSLINIPFRTTEQLNGMRGEGGNGKDIALVMARDEQKKPRTLYRILDNIPVSLAGRRSLKRDRSSADISSGGASCHAVTKMERIYLSSQRRGARLRKLGANLQL